ncbi:MAG: D-tyrosyl-tRNA(Tyr) deacylase, partial [Betaproteobacteria bacterium]
LGYRVFSDGAGKMNLSVEDVQGGLLLVPQFTLAADTSKGMRPSFSSALAPDAARTLFDHLVGRARSRYSKVACGRFGEHMHVGLVNDGPVTFWLRASPAPGPDSGTPARL